MEREEGMLAMERRGRRKGQIRSRERVAGVHKAYKARIRSDSRHVSY
jgi:hypothetical protein